MAILFASPFDHISATTATSWFDGGVSLNTSGGNGIIAGAGRNGVAGLRLVGPLNMQTVRKLVPSAPATLIIQLAIKASGNAIAGAAGGATVIAAAVDGTTVQATLHLGSDGRLAVYRGVTTALLCQSAVGACPTSPAYPHVAWKITVNAATGATTLKVNNALVELFNASNVSLGTTATGLNTRASANSQITRADWGSQGSASSGNAFDLCDFVLLDTTGTINNDFIGDKRVRYYPPTGDGAATQGTIGGTSPAATAWQGVSELASDEGVTLNTYPSSPLKNLYQWAGPPGNATGIAALIPVERVAKDDAGTNTVHTVLRGNAGTEAESADKTLTTSYGWVYDVRETDPETGAAWTPAGATGTQFGMKRVA